MPLIWAFNKNFKYIFLKDIFNISLIEAFNMGL